MARQVRSQKMGMAFEAYREGKRLGEIGVALPGRHNVLNTLAVLAVGEELGVSWEQAREALQGFTGVQRRFQIYGEVDGVLVVDDYGHHPTEIRATLEAARGCSRRRTVVLFQPHRYTRTRDLYGEFTRAFREADVIMVTEIYPASEESIPGVTGEWLAEGIREAGHQNVIYVEKVEEAFSRIKEMLQPGDHFLTLGAGNVFQVARQMVPKHQGG